MRIGVGNLLQRDTSLEITGEANTREEAIAKAIELEPDILLLDVNMLQLQGLEAMHTALADVSGSKIILLTATISVADMMKILEAGVRGIVPEDSLTDQLIPAIRGVAAGHYWIEGRRALELPDALNGLTQEITPPEATNFGLTPRELEVVRCIVEGCSNRDIAQQFQLSEETVKRHLSNVFDKTGVSTRLELALFAIQHQLVVPNR